MTVRGLLVRTHIKYLSFISEYKGLNYRFEGSKNRLVCKLTDCSDLGWCDSGVLLQHLTFICGAFGGFFLLMLPVWGW